ncbi:MAG: hypothetical protein AB1750_19740, partial [Chloroflexota bacterium]
GVYSMHVVYENLKMVVALTGRGKEIPNRRYSLCPNLGDGDVSFVTIALVAPNDAIDVKTIFGYPFYDNELPLEEVTNLSLEEFYDLILNGEPACLDVK